jgi:hypothetical protein
MWRPTSLHAAALLAGALAACAGTMPASLELRRVVAVVPGLRGHALAVDVHDRTEGRIFPLAALRVREVLEDALEGGGVHVQRDAPVRLRIEIGELEIDPGGWSFGACISIGASYLAEGIAPLHAVGRDCAVEGDGRDASRAAIQGAVVDLVRSMGSWQPTPG